MGIVDLTLLFLLSLFAVRGFFKGLFREIFSLLGLFVGFMAAVTYDEPVSALWQDYWRVSPIIIKVISFVALFFAVYLVFNLAGGLLHRSAKFLFLGGLNRVGGILLGTGKGAAFLALILFLLGSLPLIPRQMRQRVDNSYLAPPLSWFGGELIEIGKDTLLSRQAAGKNDGAGSGRV